jgi:hypothetical protein
MRGPAATALIVRWSSVSRPRRHSVFERRLSVVELVETTPGGRKRL